METQPTENGEIWFVFWDSTMEFKDPWETPDPDRTLCLL